MPAFVTATGTGIGKTFVTAGLIHHLKRQGRKVEAIKPVVSGFEKADAAASDPGILLAALGLPPDENNIARISPWRFSAPLSPDMAAAREGGKIDFDALVAFSRKAATAATGEVLIEGVGGIMVPLDAEHTTLDWMRVLNFPTVLVAGSYLGTISHTLSAVEVLKASDCDLRAIVVSETPDSGVGLDETIAAIARFVPVEVIALPRLAERCDRTSRLRAHRATLRPSASARTAPARCVRVRKARSSARWSEPASDTQHFRSAG